jgi:hypothetical protein
MKARWVLHNPQPEMPVIGQAIVASWWPGRFHVVSTTKSDGTSALARLTATITTGQPFEEVTRGAEMLVTQIFRCDRHGVVRGGDFDKPLYSNSYSTLEDAQSGHKTAVELFAAGKLSV